MKNRKIKKSLLEKKPYSKRYTTVSRTICNWLLVCFIQTRDSKVIDENFIEVSENRIRSMALIHEYLYESEENINYVNFGRICKQTE
jgi:hypothetical protein